MMDEIGEMHERILQLAKHPPADARHIPPHIYGEELERKNWLKALMYSKAAELFRLELKADRIAREGET